MRRKTLGLGRATALVGTVVMGCGAGAGIPDPEDTGGSPASLHGTVDPSSNTDGQELAGNCAAKVTAPTVPADLVNGQALAQNQAQITGAQWATSSRLTATQPVVTLTRTSGAPWFGMGFYAKNGQGSVAPGGPANQAVKAPLLLQIKAYQGAVEKGMLRFWTYQGLKPGTGSARFDGTGIPEGYGTPETTETFPAYMGIALPTLPFDKVRIEVLNPGALAGPWTLEFPKVAATPANTTCWHADPSWRLVTNPEEYAPGEEPPFTHLLRTESHATHAGHTGDHYWEFNVYADPEVGPASGSVLAGSGASGNLTSPAPSVV